MYRFNLGQILMTPGVIGLFADISEASKEVAPLLIRHASGDWGEVCAEDAKTNEDAIKYKNRILSVYYINEEKIWIITEADRSCTTILLPSEY